MIKGELAGLWYAEVDPLSLFLMLLLFGDLLLAQCGSVKAQHGVLLKTHHLSKEEVSVLTQLLHYFGLFRQYC